MKLHTLADIRTERAHKLAATAPSWLKIRSTETGRLIGYGVPSQSREGLFHMANATTCDCMAWKYRQSCVHQRAVELHEAHMTVEGVCIPYPFAMECRLCDKSDNSIDAQSGLCQTCDTAAVGAEMPASATLDGLTQMVRDRRIAGVILAADIVRED